MVVKGVYVRGELSFNYGEPKSGKSFIMTDCALAIACGDESWFGYRIKQSGLVVYCAMEGAGVFPRPRRRAGLQGALSRIAASGRQQASW